MIFSASSTASANGLVSTATLRTRTCSSLRHGTGRSRRRPAIRRDPEARQVIEGQRGLVGAHVPCVRDPPLAVLAARVPVLVERRARDHHPVLGRDHRVLEAPGAGGRVAVDVYLRLAGEVHGDDVRPEPVAQERDDAVPAGQLQRLAERGCAVVGGGVRGKGLRQLVPQLQIYTAQVAVLHPADLLERGKLLHRGGTVWPQRVHGTMLAIRRAFSKNLFYFSGQWATQMAACQRDPRQQPSGGTAGDALPPRTFPGGRRAGGALA